MKINYLSIIREKGEFDFEVSAMIEDLTREEYEQLKSILITSIGSMELMRRNHIEEFCCLQQENTQLKQQLKDKDEKISKVKEYITSYESISTIQNLENAKENIKLDEKTTIEMCRRYLIVHDKILEILESNKED